MNNHSLENESMNGKKILALVGAVVIGLIAVKIFFGLLSFLWSVTTVLLYIGVAGVIIYGLYRGFHHMLDSGKRLT